MGRSQLFVDKVPDQEIEVNAIGAALCGETRERVLSRRKEVENWETQLYFNFMIILLLPYLEKGDVCNQRLPGTRRSSLVHSLKRFTCPSVVISFGLGSIIIGIERIWVLGAGYGPCSWVGV